MREFRSVALQPHNVRRAVLTCVIVGTILVIITQASSVISGDWSASMAWQIPLTFIVPFVVSLSTSVMADRSNRNAQDSPSSSQLAKLNEFPEQNPNPVLRVSLDGVIQYANPASVLVCEALGANVGQEIVHGHAKRIIDIANSGMPGTIEVEGGGCTFALLVIGVLEHSFINIYGTDITAVKVLRKFPDLNPSPVMRMSSDGELEYTNAAGMQVAEVLQIGLGDPFPAEVQDSIRAVQHGHAVDPVQVSGAGRTYSLTPAYTAEFGITNIYGEDITARLAMNKFPDQNPNPVLRVSTSGAVEYTNPAGEVICEAIGATVGENIPADFLQQLTRIVQSGSSETIEVETGGHTFALLVVGLTDFACINIYGTDITALKVLRKFPDLNPSPVMRMSSGGELEYTNAAGMQVAEVMGVKIGDPLPAKIQDNIRAVQDGRSVDPVLVNGGGRTFSLTPAYTAEFDMTNIYGQDITARIAMNKFPDQNPNPVLRVSMDGIIEYANPASALVCEALGASTGDQVPAEYFQRMKEIANSGSSDTIEVSANGRTFALLVVGLFEFSFINIYGTEITDALALEEAHRDNELLLLNILPTTIADRLKSGESLIADSFDEMTVLFADVVDFTRMASRMGAEQVVMLLNDIFTMFDELAGEYELEKIKTIGDAYMVVGGLGEHSVGHAERVAEMGISMLRVLKEHAEKTGTDITVRIGMHTGPVVAGVVGIKKFIYDVWGETVNTASRMESHGVPGRIQVEDATRARLEDVYEFEDRGIVDVKGIGKIRTHLLVGRRDD